MASTRKRKAPLRSRNEIGAFIRLWREYRGYTQDAFARLVGWSPVRQCRIELRQIPDAADLAVLASALEVPVDALYGPPPEARAS